VDAVISIRWLGVSPLLRLRLPMLALVTVAMAGACTMGNLPSPPPVVVSGGYRITFVSPAPDAAGAPTAPPAPTARPSSATPRPSTSTSTPSAPSTGASRPSATPAPATAKRVKVVVASQHFSLMLPGVWVPLVIDGASVQDGIGRVINATGNHVSPAQLQSVIDQMHDVLPAGVKFWGVKPSSFDSSKGFISVVMILGTPAPGVTPAQVEAQTATQLQAMGSSVSSVRHQQVRLSNGSAVWFSYTQKTAAAGGRIGTFAANSWFILRDGYAYAVFFATLKPATAAELREFSAIAGSIAPAN
jgi:hypothetical protein